MKIGPAIENIETIVGITKYHAVWRALDKLRGDEWLPVECDSPKDAWRLYMAARKREGVRAHVLGLMVYISRNGAAKP